MHQRRETGPAPPACSGQPSCGCPPMAFSLTSVSTSSRGPERRRGSRRYAAAVAAPQSPRWEVVEPPRRQSWCERALRSRSLDRRWTTQASAPLRCASRSRRRSTRRRREPSSTKVKREPALASGSLQSSTTNCGHAMKRGWSALACSTRWRKSSTSGRAKATRAPAVAVLCRVGTAWESARTKRRLTSCRIRIGPSTSIKPRTLAALRLAPITASPSAFPVLSS